MESIWLLNDNTNILTLKKQMFQVQFSNVANLVLLYEVCLNFWQESVENEVAIPATNYGILQSSVVYIISEVEKKC